MSRPHVLKRFVTAAVLVSICSALCHIHQHQSSCCQSTFDEYSQTQRSLLTCASSFFQETAMRA